MMTGVPVLSNKQRCKFLFGAGWLGKEFTSDFATDGKKADGEMHFSPRDIKSTSKLEQKVKSCRDG